MILFLTFCISVSLFAQKKTQGYRIEGDEVVFVFDKRDYKEVTHGLSQHRKSIDDTAIAIEMIAVAGKFNNWSEDEWIMTKIDENRYELRKKMADFTDEFSWEFKFVINEEYWAEPEGDIENLSKAKRKGKDLNVYNLKMYTAYISENGNAKFFLKGYQQAEKVILSGSFNKWNEELFEMKKAEDGWYLTLQLRPDVYEYKFIVDNIWITDEANPNQKENEFGGYNSLIDIKAYYTFTLSGYKDAKNVMLAGSFNDWSKDGFKMSKTEEGWEISILLSSGKHQYKFIVDQDWILDPNNPIKEYDYKGNVNSVCMVR
ncbi:MAG: glycogen-binding domain-containing protein [Bacteroidota bacterium]